VRGVQEIHVERKLKEKEHESDRFHFD
jgi:hypothetical protein